MAALGRSGSWSAIARSDEDDDQDASGRNDSERNDSGRDDRDGDGDSGHHESGHDASGRDENREDERDDESVAVTGQVPAGALEVRIVSEDADAFQPRELTVDLGQSISFVNAHDDEHTATGAGFDTGVIDRGQIVTVVFDEPGVFPYACQFHPVMTGSIRVRDTNGVVPQPAAETGPPPADATPVSIANFAFDPAQITVAAGSTVAWTNNDSVPHTVTAQDGAFDSGILDPGASFSWTFAQPGSFAYLCQLHPQMQGSVSAEGEPTASMANSAAGTDQQPASAGATAAPETQTGGADVAIMDFAFEPATVEVSAGTTVVWTNTGQAPHTVTGAFADSGALSPGQAFSHTFAEAGAFDYVCSFHPQMIGRVQVGAAAAGAGTTDTLGTLESGAQTAGQDRNALVGAWLVSITPDDATAFPPQQALVTLRADGAVEADYAAAGEATGAPAWTIREGMGIWEETNGGYSLSVAALLVDEQERYAGVLTLQETGQIDATGETMRGLVTFEVTGRDGGTNTAGSATAEGTRIRFDEP